MHVRSGECDIPSLLRWDILTLRLHLCDKYHITLDWIYRSHDAMLPHGFAKRLQEVAEGEPETNA